jgi:hypothetical protein
MMIEIILCLALMGFSSQHEPGWKGIVPLHSTRADVEQLLGAPTEPCTEGCDYDTKNEGVFVRYSAGRCAEGDSIAWNVPPNTVISLSINLAKTPRLSALRLNLKKFKKTADPELRGYSSYENEDKGISYEVSDDGRVYSINRFATSKDDKAFRCPRVRASISIENAQMHSDRCWPVHEAFVSIGSFLAVIS